MAQKFKIKKDDTVMVTTGSQKGKTGKVIKVLVDDQKLIVDGVNLSYKHKRGKGRETIARPIHISNVALQDPKNPESPTKVGYKFQDGKKIRFAKKSNATIDE